MTICFEVEGLSARCRECDKDFFGGRRCTKTNRLIHGAVALGWTGRSPRLDGQFVCQKLKDWLLQMAIEISTDATKAAIGSIQRYFAANLNEEIGGLAAGALLSFFLKEIGPVVYNKGVADAQTRMQERVMELDVEVYEEAFTYWAKQGRQGTRQK